MEADEFKNKVKPIKQITSPGSLGKGALSRDKSKYRGKQYISCPIVI